MKVAVSACLMGRNCKYSGGNNLDEELVRLLAGCEIVEVCPEVAGGLPTPRPPAEIVGERVGNTEGIDVTEEFEAGARVCCAEAEGCVLAILQPRSPSCGVHQVYDGTFSGKLVEGSGVFARMLTERGVLCLEPDEARERYWSK